MPKTDILAKVVFRLLTVIAFVFGFIGYVITLRPKIQEITNEYTLGLIEGGLIVFTLTVLPLAYAYLIEKEKYSEDD